MASRKLSNLAVSNHIVIALCAVVSFTAESARAEFGNLLFNLSASDATELDRFGRSVAISGNTAIVGRGNLGGVSGSDDDPATPDAVYVFDIVTGQQLRTLHKSGGNDAFVVSEQLGISGNTAIVGAELNDTAGRFAGAAYLFDVETGQELFKLTASDAAENDRFGDSVAISGNIAVVGAPNQSTAGYRAGAAYLFDVTSGQELFKLTASGALAEDRFGGSVAISGNSAIVGAIGAAYVFDVTTGNELFKLTASDGFKGDGFGGDVGISGNVAIVARSTALPGAAYLFDVTTGQGLRKLTPSDSAPNDRFGNHVAISGNTAIVTAPSRHGASPANGRAYVFDVTTGQELLKLDGSDRSDEGFGNAVALDGSKAIIGAPSYANVPDLHGSAYVFDVSRISGDFNNNGTVDAADYIVLRNGLGTTYTQTDYNTWRANFGRSAASAAGATAGGAPFAVANLPSSTTPPVPEPSAFCLGILSVCYWLAAARRRRYAPVLLR